MNWGKFIAISLGIFIILCAALFWGYGTLVLYDNVIPLNNYPKDKWVFDYAFSGVVAAAGGFLCSVGWFAIGESFDGKSSVAPKYWILMFVSLLLSFGSLSFLTPAAAEGTGLSTSFVVLVAPLGYYLSSLFASSDAVKYIPPLGSVIH